MIYLDWQLLIGGTLIVVVLLIELLDWATKPKKRNYKKATTTCYRFETGEKPDHMTLYLKQKLVDEAGVDPKKGLTVTIEQKK